MHTINEVWHSRDERAWLEALDRYWDFIKPANLALERELEGLELNRLRDMDANEWYGFLHDKYFPWKYTAANRLATTRNKLMTHQTSERAMMDLFSIKDRLLNLRLDDPIEGLCIAKSIRGLGVAGASGLLALMYPGHFATVDQFIVKALRNVEGLQETQALRRMKPEGLQPKDGVILIQIMREKAAENNAQFKTDAWTPRKIDKVLWTCGH